MRESHVPVSVKEEEEEEEWGNDCHLIWGIQLIGLAGNFLNLDSIMRDCATTIKAVLRPRRDRLIFPGVPFTLG